MANPKELSSTNPSRNAFWIKVTAAYFEMIERSIDLNAIKHSSRPPMCIREIERYEKRQKYPSKILLFQRRTQTPDQSTGRPRTIFTGSTNRTNPKPEIGIRTTKINLKTEFVFADASEIPQLDETMQRGAERYLSNLLPSQQTIVGPLLSGPKPTHDWAMEINRKRDKPLEKNSLIAVSKELKIGCEVRISTAEVNGRGYVFLKSSRR